MDTLDKLRIIESDAVSKEGVKIESLSTQHFPQSYLRLRLCTGRTFRMWQPYLCT